MTNVTEVEAQLRTLLRDAYDRMDYRTDFEDKLLRVADRADHLPGPPWRRSGAGLLAAAAVVAAVAIAAVVVPHRHSRPATPPTPSTPDTRILNVGVAPGAGLTIVAAASGYDGNARHLVQTLELSGSHGSYLVEALHPGDQLDTLYHLPALESAQRVNVGKHPGYYFACVRGGTTCPPMLAWTYRSHAWATITSNNSTTAPALRDAAAAVRFTEQTPMRMAVALPYAPQHLRPTAIVAQYAKVQGLGRLVVQSAVDFSRERNATPIVVVGISRGSLSASSARAPR
jgi:hypothetical protein